MSIEVAKKLAEYRENAGFSQQELADKLGVDCRIVADWENGVSSPDTDKLIALSRIYGVSLDEMLGNTASGEGEENEQADGEPEPASVKFSGFGVHVVDKSKNTEVHVSPKGVYVRNEGDEVVNLGKDEAKEYFKEHHGDFCKDKNGENKSAWSVFPFPVFVTIIYIICGVCLNCWHPLWLIFLLIPLYYTVIEAVRKHDAKHFAYPVLVVLAFLLAGFYTPWGWHPGWVMFLTIPIYYWVCELFKKD